MAQSASVNWDKLRPWLGTVIRVVLGVVWIWAALSKLASPRTFVQAVRAYDVTPEWLSKGIGYGLPVAELAIGIVLVLGIAVRLAAAVSALLFVMFLIGIIQAAARGIQLECGCFGGGGTTTAAGTNYTWDILRDIGLVLLAAFLVYWPMTMLSVDAYIARNDNIEQPSAKRMRTDAGRRKYNALLEVRRKEAQSRNRWISGSLAGVIVLVALIGVGVQSGRAKIEGSLTATHASVADGVVYGKKAAATVDVYEDAQCPVCESYEGQVGKTMQADVVANKAQVRYHLISFLDSSSSGNRYSSRAANAAYCASDVSPDAFHSYHSVLYGTYNGQKTQPAEGGNGRTDAQLVAYGRAAGITGAKLTTFASCVRNETHAALVQAITDKSSQDGVSGTPTVFVNGAKIANTLAAFNTAVTKALKSGPAPDPSPAPSSSAAVSTPATTSSSPATAVPATSGAAAPKSTANAAPKTSAKP